MLTLGERAKIHTETPGFRLLRPGFNSTINNAVTVPYFYLISSHELIIKD